jgi:hypothetical protein
MMEFLDRLFGGNEEQQELEITVLEYPPNDQQDCGVNGDPFEETDPWLQYHCEWCGGWVSGCQHGWPEEN